MRSDKNDIKNNNLEDEPVPENDPLDPRNSKERAEIRSREVFYKGDTIIKQGEEAYRAFYIESGRVEIVVQENNTELKITELMAGDIIGEMALIEDSPRTATVRALDTTSTVTISRDEIKQRIANIEDKAIQALINLLIARLRETTKGQLHQYQSLTDFQDRVTGVVDKIGGEFDANKREKFRSEAEPLLDKLQEVLDKYKS